MAPNSLESIAALPYSRKHLSPVFSLRTVTQAGGFPTAFSCSARGAQREKIHLPWAAFLSCELPSLKDPLLHVCQQFLLSPLHQIYAHRRFVSLDSDNLVISTRGTCFTSAFFTTLLILTKTAKLWSITSEFLSKPTLWVYFSDF
jgi:hypothetical protein